MCLEFCTSFEDKTVSPCTCFGGLRSASKDIYPFMIDRNVLRSGFTSPRPGPVKFSSARGFCMKTCLSVDPEATSRWTSLFSSVRCDVIYPPPPRISRNKQNNTRLWWSLKEIKIHAAARWWSQLGSSFRTRKSGPGSDIRVYTCIYTHVHVAFHGMNI